MIIEAVIDMVVLVILGVIGLFPTIPALDLSFLDGVFRVLSLIDTFISVKVVAVCFSTIFIFLYINVIWAVIMWVVRKIPGVE